MRATKCIRSFTNRCTRSNPRKTGSIADTKARRLAKEKKVDIYTYRVIYELIDAMKEIMGGVLEPEERERRLSCFEDVTHVEIADAGHMIHYDAPAQLRDEIAAFLEAKLIVEAHEGEAE